MAKEDKKPKEQTAEVNETKDVAAEKPEVAEAQESTGTEEAGGGEDAEEAKVSGSAKTDRVKQHIQAIIKQQLGVKVSKQAAWDLFKAIIHGMVQFTLNDEKQEVPLAGVGTFKVLQTKPRKSKVGKMEYVPKFRFYPSSVIDKLLEQSAGFEDHGIKQVDYGLFAKDVPADDEEPEKPKAKSKAKADPKKEDVPADDEEL